MRRLALSAMLLVACGRGESRTADSGQRTAGVPDSALPAVSSPGGPLSAVRCPPTGLWAECSVLERLDRAGLAPRRDSSTATEEPLSAPGFQLLVGTGRVEVYVYADAPAREREQEKLEKTKYVRFDAPVTMKVLPTLISNTNLIAILHSRNDHLRERVADALTAGPPQAPRTP